MSGAECLSFGGQFRISLPRVGPASARRPAPSSRVASFLFAEESPAAPPAPDVDDSAPAAPPDDDSDAHAPPGRLFAMGRELMGMLEAGVTGAAVVGLLDSMREAAAAAGAF